MSILLTKTRARLKSISFSFLILSFVFCIGCTENSLPEVDLMRVHIAKGGQGWIEVTLIIPPVLAKDIQNSFAMPSHITQTSELGILDNYDLMKRKERQTNLPDGSVRVFSYGEFQTVFDLVEILDSSHPFSLHGNKQFKVEWDGNILDLEMSFLNKKGKAEKATLDEDYRLELTTDGHFADVSTGRLIEKRTKLIVDPENSKSFKLLRLRIEGLSED